MSLIVLYFLHSTSVLSFYIDRVLTLSMSIAMVVIMTENNFTYVAKWPMSWSTPASFVAVEKLTGIL